MFMKINKIRVNTHSKNYYILVGRNLIEKIDKIFNDNNIHFEKCLVVSDRNVPNKFKKTLYEKLKSKKILKVDIFASEKNKSHKTVEKIQEILFNKRFNREDCVISFGGGIIGDLVGFASSTFKRGIKFINIPSTLLSQVDSSIGGKTGINNKFGKNLIGSFYQPDLVISDINILKSLPKREIICGYAEIFKSSIIDNYNSFLFLEKNLENILKLNSPFIEKSILNSCNLKKSSGKRRKREKFKKSVKFRTYICSRFWSTLGFSKKLNHGEAVILGIKSAAEFSYKRKFYQKEKFKIILNHIDKIEMRSKINNLFKKKHASKILKFMENDKKNNSNKINLVLIKDFGKIKVDFQISSSSLKKYISNSLN